MASSWAEDMVKELARRIEPRITIHVDWIAGTAELPFAEEEIAAVLREVGLVEVLAIAEPCGHLTCPAERCQTSHRFEAALCPLTRKERGDG